MPWTCPRTVARWCSHAPGALASLPALALLAGLLWVEALAYLDTAHALPQAAGLGRHAPLRWGLEALAVAMTFAASLAWARLAREHLRQRRSLQGLSELSSALFDTVGAMLMVLDREGCIVRFNRAAQEFVGHGFDAVRERPMFWIRFLPPACRDEVVGVFRRLLDGDAMPRYDNPWVDRQGRERMFEWHNSLLRDADGQVRYLVTLGVDVTEARDAAGRLRDSESRYRNLVEHAHDAILLIDADARVALVNPAGVALLGARSPQQLLGVPVLDIVAPASRARVAQRMGMLQAGQASVPASTVRMLRLDGAEVEVESVASADLSGGARKLHVILRDLGERRRLEREVVEAAGAEQERIGREIHDGLGQRLTALGLACAALQRSLTRAGQAQHAQAAGRLLQDLQQATTEARDLARGLSPIRLETGSIGVALRELVEGVGRSSGLACRLDLQGEPGEVDDEVATQLYRIVQEALHNAVKHAQARRIEVQLQVRRGCASLLVRDDGVGLEASRTDGLGMLTMRHRAALVGGTLEIVSAPDAGTSVRCRCAARGAAQGARPG